MKFIRSVSDWRYYSFIFLIVAAPLSKYPSIAAPLFNFSSFRIGLYQVAALLFVIACIKPIFAAGGSFFTKQQSFAFRALLLMAVLALASIAWSLYPARSTLLGASFVLLIAVVISAWWYTASQLNKARWGMILRSMLFASVLYGLLSVFQLLVFTLSDQTLGVMCPGCTAEVFGFPRINGLAAEPQFFANAMLPFVFAAVYAVIKSPSKLAWGAFVSSLFTIGLTFSRGAYFAAAAALIATLVVLIYKKYVDLNMIVKIILVGFFTLCISLSALTISATIRYSDTPNITYETVDSIFEHLTLGVINLPEKTVVVVQPAAPAVPAATSTDINQSNEFVSPGLIESSGNERLSAAELAIKAWFYHPLTILFGVGIGNLGPFVVQNIDANAPENLTVYIYYILLVSELGLVGIILFSTVFISALVHLLRKHSVASICIAGGLFSFSLQFLFFGSYINVMYIWLWLGIALGAAVSLKINNPKIKKV